MLVLYYAPLVKYVAGRVASSFPRSVDISDLISYGMWGLIDAIEKYNLEREIKFETYAISRIKGAMIDELRALDWVPRSLRSKAKELERTYFELERDLKRIPTDDEVAEAMGISSENLQKMLSELSYSSLIALEDLWTVGLEDDSKVSILDAIEDQKATDPFKILEEEELRSILLETIKSLPQKESEVISFYYYEGFTLKEIAEILGVSESRVSQLHAKALLRLRGRLRAKLATG